MSFPTAVTNGNHLDLALNGSKVAVLDSIKLKSLAKPILNKASLSHSEVLPSITPSCESTTPDHTVIDHRPSPLGLSKENNILSKYDSTHSHLYKPVGSDLQGVASKLPVTTKNILPQSQSCVSPHWVEPLKSTRLINLADIDNSDDPKLCISFETLQKNGEKITSISDTKQSGYSEQATAAITAKNYGVYKLSNTTSAQSQEMFLHHEETEDQVYNTTKNHNEDTWEDTENIEIEASGSSVKPKMIMKKKLKRSKSKQRNKSLKANKVLTTEEVYTDLSLLQRHSELEASCVPAKILRMSPNKPQNKIDYSRHINDKAPYVTKPKPENKTESLLKKTKELLLNTLSKSHRNSRPKVQEKSSSLDKTEKHLLSSSADPCNFKIHVNNANLTLQRKSLGSAPTDVVVPRVIKVYLSEKQSKAIEELGVEIPCAPPATPTKEMLQKFEYIPCMSDIRAQRVVKMKLENLLKVENQRRQKIREQKMKKERMQNKEQMKQLRKQQRREIYALNKVMKDFELSNFANFCQQNSLPMMN